MMTDIPTYHVDSSRSGLNSNFLVPGGGTWRKYATLLTAAPVRAAPLYLKGYTFAVGSHAGETHDVVIIADSANNVYTYAEDQLLAFNTTPLWTQNVGQPSSRSGSNIPPPIGICGTPVVNRDKSSIYLIAYIHDNTSNTDHYEIVALDLDTGNPADHRPLVDPSSPAPGAFDPTTQDQRTGLNLVNGWIYATFAAFFANDEGQYRGWMVACNEDQLSQQLFIPLISQTHTGAGIWGPGGAVAAADGSLYVSTGNSPSLANDGSYWSNLAKQNQHPGDVSDWFEGVVRVQMSSTNSSLSVVNYYQPTWAETLNDQDLDFGGSSSIVLPSTINRRQLVVTTAKDGNVYLLSPTLGGWGGELWSSVTDPNQPLHGVFSSESKCAPAYFQATDLYVYVVGAGNPGLVAFRVDTSTSTTPKLVRAWDAGMSFSDAPGSPFVIADPTTKNALVWVVDGIGTAPAVLRAFDAISGALVFHSDAGSGNDVGMCPNFAPVVGAGKSVFVGTNTGVVAYMNVPPSLKLIMDQTT